MRRALERRRGAAFGLRLSVLPVALCRRLARPRPLSDRARATGRGPSASHAGSTMLAGRLALGLLAVCLAAGAARASGWEESGQASWYGGSHAGRRTSSGDRFNPEAMTAAHPSLPLGSRIRVTMQDTGASVVVTVTDRQPWHGHRIIDLSRGAAERIGLARRGTGEVTLALAGAGEPVEVAEAPDDAVAPDMAGGMPGDIISPAPLSSRRHGGRPHTRHVVRAAWVAPPCCHVPSAARARSSAPHRAARHRP